MKVKFLAILWIALLPSCGKSSDPASSAAGAAEVHEHAPPGDPATLPKVPADALKITTMLGERFGDAVVRNLRIGIEDQGRGKRVSLSGEVPNEEIRQAVMKELEARVTDMKSEDFTLSVAGPIRQVFSFDAYLGGNDLVTFSNDLTLAFTDHGDIYEVATGRRINRMLVPQEKAESIAISPDRKTVAMGRGAGVILLWDLPLGRNQRTLSPAAPPTAGYQTTAALQFTADSKHLVAINSEFGEVVVWDLANGSSKTIGAHRAKDASQGSSDIYVLAVSPDGSLIASANDRDSAVSLWDVKTRSRRLLTGEPLNSKAIAWSHNGKTLAVARGTGERRGPVLFDVATGKATLLSREHDDIINALAFSPDDKTLAAGYRGAGTVIWDLATNKEWMTLDSEKVSSGTAIAFSPDGTLLATDCQSLRPACIRLWDVSKRPGAKGAAVRLPATLNVTTLQDDRFVAGMDRSLRQYQESSIESLSIEVLGPYSVRLTGRVVGEETKRRMGIDAEGFYLFEDTYGSRHNSVINDLQVAGRSAPR